MKKIFTFLIVCVVCNLHAQRKPKIKGSRTVVEVNKALPEFHSIVLNDDLKIELRKAAKEGYSVTADDNLIDVLKFKVVDSVLTISAFYKITSKKKLDITIDYVELKAITMNDGEIDGDDNVISSDDLTVHTFGASRLVLNATASIMNITMQGMSSADFNLASDSLNVTLKDRVDARVYAVGASNIVNIHNNASAKIEGTADGFLVNLSDNANLKAEKLEAITIYATLEGSSHAHLNAVKSLELSSSGSSKTYVYGEGKIVLLDFLDTSQLNKVK